MEATSIICAVTSCTRAAHKARGKQLNLELLFKARTASVLYLVELPLELSHKRNAPVLRATQLGESKRNQIISFEGSLPSLPSDVAISDRVPLSFLIAAPHRFSHDRCASRTIPLKTIH